MNESILKEHQRENDERLHYALTTSEEELRDWDLQHDTGYLSPRYYEMLGDHNHAFSADHINRIQIK